MRQHPPLPNRFTVPAQASRETSFRRRMAGYIGDMLEWLLAPQAVTLPPLLVPRNIEAEAMAEAAANGVILLLLWHPWLCFFSRVADLFSKVRPPSRCPTRRAVGS